MIRLWAARCPMQLAICHSTMARRPDGRCPCPARGSVVQEADLRTIRPTLIRSHRGTGSGPYLRRRRHCRGDVARGRDGRDGDVRSCCKGRRGKREIRETGDRWNCVLSCRCAPARCAVTAGDAHRETASKHGRLARGRRRCVCDICMYARGLSRRLSRPATGCYSRTRDGRKGSSRLGDVREMVVLLARPLRVTPQGGRERAWSPSPGRGVHTRAAATCCSYLVAPGRRFTPAGRP